jgi:hypothetical protein
VRWLDGSAIRCDVKFDHSREWEVNKKERAGEAAGLYSPQMRLETASAVNLRVR